MIRGGSESSPAQSPGGSLALGGGVSVVVVLNKHWYGVQALVILVSTGRELHQRAAFI